MVDAICWVKGYVAWPSMARSVWWMLPRYLAAATLTVRRQRSAHWLWTASDEGGSPERGNRVCACVRLVDVSEYVCVYEVWEYVERVR